MSLNPYAPPPQPYAAYAQAPAQPPVSIRTPALVAQSALGFASGAYLLALPFTIWSFFLLSESETLFTGAMISLGVGLLTAATMIFGAVTFIVWLFRARTVVDPFDQQLEWKRGWSIGGWFIPIANYFIPLLVVGEITRLARDRSGQAGTRTPFYVWSASWTLFLLVSNLSNLSSLGDTTADGPVAVSGGVIVFDVVGTALLAVAGVSGILMIRRTTADLAP